jgi:nitrogen fixation NifU-like protein
MTLDARSLYQSVILDYAKSPRNQGVLANATHAATMHNPLCGDRVTLQLAVDEGTIRAAKFEGRGCMIARASASLLTETIIGMAVIDALELITTVESLTTDTAPKKRAPIALESFRGARAFPARHACVMLAWRALEQSLAQSEPEPESDAPAEADPPEDEP